jgi:hypothetical protein
LSRVVSAPADQTLGGIAEPELDVEIGRPVVQQADGLSDHKGRRARSDEGHGNGFAGKIAPPAIVAAEMPVARIFARHALAIRRKLRLFFLAQVPGTSRRADAVTSI